MKLSDAVNQARLTLPTEQARRDALTPGTLVWYDQMIGRSVACKITAREAGRFSADRDILTLKVTGTSGTYKRGETIRTNVGPFVRAR